MQGRGGRRVVPHIAAGLFIAASSIVYGTAAANADAPVCTFNDESAIVADVVAGQTINVQCTGLVPLQSISINEESPLAAIVEPSTSAAFESNSALAVNATADGSGTATTQFTVPVALGAADPHATCPPTQEQVDAGLASCALTVRDAPTNTLVAGAHLLYVGQPTSQTTPSISVTNGPSYVAGNVVSISGSGFWGAPPASTPIAAFGLTPAAPLGADPLTASATTYVCDTDCNGTGATLTAGGLISGSVVVPSGLVSGPTTLSVLQTTSSGLANGEPVASLGASASVMVLGAATAAATPNLGPPGAVVQVTGTGWDPQGPTADLAFLVPSTVGGATSIGTAVVDANGNLSGTITVTGQDAPGVNPIKVTQGPTSAQAQFTVTSDTSQCLGANCNADQLLTQSVGQGNLSVSQTSAAVGLSPIVLSGVVQHSTGQLNPITVVDDRGILVGWTVTGTLAGDFVNVNPIGSLVNNTIPASNLTWTPSVALATPGSGELTQVTAGESHSLSKTDGTTLCAAPVAGGGGSFICSAELDLAVPASIALGTYTVVLNITVT